MKENYVRCLANSLVFEGGYANHPSDPGGATNRGITQGTYNAWRKSKGKALQSVKLLTETELQTIYRERFWNLVAGDIMPKGVDQVAFDGGVNSGPSRGVAWVAKAIGKSGNALEIAKSAQLVGDKVKVVKSACANRAGFVKGLGTFKVFGKGWLKRIAQVEAIGVKMALEEVKSVPEQTIALEENVTKAEKGKTQAVSGATGTGVAGGGAATQVDVTAFDWTGWLITGIFVLVLTGLLLYCLYQWKFNKERVLAYKDVLEGKLEASWQDAWAEVQTKIKRELI